MAIQSLPDHNRPASIDALAEMLREASECGSPVVPWGAGMHQYIGNPPPDGALFLHTGALNRIVDYTPSDLTITVEAGVSLAAIQEVLRPHGQWLPWELPGSTQATIGGLLAVGVAGPLRLGYGTARDRTLGMRMVLGDGRLVKSGGRVVKNVAGYDAHKLHIGALGTLGVIAEVTFKLAPLPERQATCQCECTTLGQALELAERLRVLEPAGLLVVSEASAPGVYQLIARFDGVAAAVARRLASAAEAARAADARFDDTVAWEWVAGLLASYMTRDTGASVIVRAGVRPAALPALLAAVEHLAPQGQHSTVALCGVGLAYMRWPTNDTLQSALAALRATLGPEGGYAVVESLPEELRSQIDVWGPVPQTFALMRELKARWDPRGVLNPGRYVGGM